METEMISHEAKVIIFNIKKTFDTYDLLKDLQEIKEKETVIEQY